MTRWLERARARWSIRAASHALWLTALSSTPGCGGEAVEARAIWVDGFAGERTRRIHVYDRGERYTIEVFGESAPQERVRLGPRGRGLVVRAGERRGAWLSLEDDRRLPMLLPPTVVNGAPLEQFSARGDALLWLDEIDRHLNLIPLAPGLALERELDGSVVPLLELGALRWVASSLDAPVLLVRHESGGASFLSYPDDPLDLVGIVRDASAPTLPAPTQLRESRSCTSAVGCYTLVGLEPGGELAIVALGQGGPWFELDRRAPELELDDTGYPIPLELPEALDTAWQTGGGLGLLAILDRSISVWLGAGQLYRWDRATDTVDSVPVFAAPPLHWTPADRGRAVVLVSLTGPMYRVDTRRLDVINLETTDCTPAPASQPVVSPDGRWAAWTCLDSSSEITAASGVVVRVSPSGIERHVGVPMSALAIDDSGDLLVYSVESIVTDLVDGVAPTSRPRSLFVLSNDGVLTRIDDLEPAPTAVLLGSNDLATYLQGAALD